MAIPKLVIDHCISEFRVRILHHPTILIVEIIFLGLGVAYDEQLRFGHEGSRVIWMAVVLEKVSIGPFQLGHFLQFYRFLLIWLNNFIFLNFLFHANFFLH